MAVMNHRRTLLYFLLVGVFSHLVYGQCNPDCSNYSEGYKVPDPKYCSRYYVCATGGIAGVDPISCPPGEKFIQLTQNCDASYQCPTPPCAPMSCHLTCTSVGDRIADPFDCGIYYDCTISGPGAATLCDPIRPYFDPINKICSSDSSVCCRRQCDPYCDPEATQAPDPTDCTKYYDCLENEPIFPSVTCDHGQNFDVKIGLCSPTAECDILCNKTSGCWTQFTCETSGYFAKCEMCDPRYYYCLEAGQAGIEELCPGDLLFDPDPDFPYCIEPEQCIILSSEVNYINK
ncbi:hypothetical protein SK128_015259 [Halocaridina rubra]|uniref:Chitin-binding type-2 domain-containing protein n=1 Tax=Halocaridina rubra TaxID=373956 RepID=A0AAN9FTW6_HALRR